MSQIFSSFIISLVVQLLCWTSIEDADISWGSITPKMIWHLKYFCYFSKQCLELSFFHVQNTFVISLSNSIMLRCIRCCNFMQTSLVGVFSIKCLPYLPLLHVYLSAIVKIWIWLVLDQLKKSLIGALVGLCLPLYSSTLIIAL